MHTVNLSGKNIRFDLVNDSIFNMKSNISKEEESVNNVKIERINLNKKNAKLLNKSAGKYISIRFDDVTDFENRQNLIDILTNELKSILLSKKLIGKDCLVVGLGNSNSTPDSLGPLTVDKVITTRYLFVEGDVDNNYSSVSKISPGVFASSGIESFDIVKGVVKQIKPSFIIVIDALSSTSLDNLCKVIQITDSGIDPGSGVSNNRKNISYKSLSIPVIALGVPTVLSINTLLHELTNKKNINNKISNIMITPKEIDFVIEKLSIVLSKAINSSLHNLTK
ncbi:MAG: GPR endopeptidase [Bacilli bacterium]|nr:GPR endopeptidase [Bacilli bacterium]